MLKKTTLLLLFFAVTIFAQVQDYQVGSSLAGVTTTGAYYNFSKPNTLNIEVNVWGWVNFPGKYLIPEYSDVMDLLSYAGGPTDAANLDDIRIYRVTITENGDTTRQFLPFNYQELLWADELEKSGLNIPILKAGDNLSVPGEPKLYKADWIAIAFSTISILISLTTLIVTLNN